MIVHIFQNGRTIDGCSVEKLLAPCTRKKRLQRNMTIDYYWIGTQENIGILSNSQSDHNSIYLSLCSINCHIHAMAGNRSVSMQVAKDSLQMVSAITGNLP